MASIKNDKKVEAVCNNLRTQLLPILQKIQDKKGYISDNDMQIVADQLDIHPVEVYSVVTFYSFFSLQKKGKKIIRVSTCMPCEMKGSKKIIKAFEKLLKIKAGETTKDGEYSLEETSCIGMCDQAPAVMINEKLIGNVSDQKIKQLLTL